MMRGRFFALLLVAAAASARPAWASPESELATAENAYAALEYQNAATAADQVLAQRGLSHDMLTRATRVSALSHAALGNGEQAKKSFILLLEYEPDYKVDAKLGPRFSEPFAEARGYWQAQGRKPGMEVEVALQWHQRGEIRVTVRDPMNTVKRVSVGYRWAPKRDYAMATNDAAGTKQVDVPANMESSARLEYFVRALDAKDGAVFEEGTPDQPKNVHVTEPARAGPAEKSSFFTSPVFLVAGGVVLVAAGVAGYFALRPTTYNPSGTARSVIGASCGGTRCD
jgi:hypothetical protein